MCLLDVLISISLCGTGCHLVTTEVLLRHTFDIMPAPPFDQYHSFPCCPSVDRKNKERNMFCCYSNEIENNKTGCLVLFNMMVVCSGLLQLRFKW